MTLWQKETLNLKVGDWIIWRGEAIELEGQTAFVSSGMRNNRHVPLANRMFGEMISSETIDSTCAPTIDVIGN